MWKWRDWLSHGLKQFQAHSRMLQTRWHGYMDVSIHSHSSGDLEAQEKACGSQCPGSQWPLSSWDLKWKKGVRVHYGVPVIRTSISFMRTISLYELCRALNMQSIAPFHTEWVEQHWIALCMFWGSAMRWNEFSSPQKVAAVGNRAVKWGQTG